MGGSKRLIKDPERYKTVICVNWANRGECPYGRKCQFAHSKEELRCRTSSLQQSPPQPPVVGGTAPPPLHMPTTAWPQPTAKQHRPLPGMPPLPPGPGPLQTASVNLSASPANDSVMGLPNTQMPQNIPSTSLPLPGLLGSSLPGSSLPGASLPGAALQGVSAADGSTHQVLSLPAANAPGLPRSTPCVHPMASHLASAAAPSIAPLAPSAQASTWSATATSAQLASAPASNTGDELAKFAMQCHIGDWRSESPDDIELRCHEITGKVEARCIAPPSAEQPPLTVGVGKDNGLGVRDLNSDGQLESPLEPGVSKREMSFSTQLVRRAVSFILNDSTFENDLLFESTHRRDITKSPQTALAA